MGTRSLTAMAVVLIMPLFAGVSANAAEQGIAGKKLLLKSNPKMVLLSKDALVVPGANGTSADPRCAPDGGGIYGTVTLDDGTNRVTLHMPCSYWSANGAGTLYKYKNAAGTPKVVKIKSGLLKVVSPGMGSFPVPNGPATVNVDVAVGTDRYCMKFIGTGDGNKFLVKDAEAEPCPPLCGNNVQEGTEECDGTDAVACPNDCRLGCICAAPCPQVGGDTTACFASANSYSCINCCVADTSCAFACVTAEDGPVCMDATLNDLCSAAANAAGCAAECCLSAAATATPVASSTPTSTVTETPVPCAATTGGFCWFLGADGDSCDTTCANQSLSCDPATLTFAGHPSGSLANCDAVLEALLGGPQSTTDSTHQSFGCALIGGTVPIRDTAAATTCAAASPFFQRACACN